MFELDFDKNGGMIPAIVQDIDSGEILMLAYMNREAWELTIEKKIAHYYSRSRKSLWKKGETSGNIQEVLEIRVDCDSDTVLLKVRQIGKAACHTGFRSCFHRVLRNGTLETDGERIFNPEDVYRN